MDKGTLARTLVLAVALVNQLLVAFGLDPIPGDESIWYEVVSSVFTFVAGAIAWFRNNYITSKGKAQREVLKEKGLSK